MVEGLTIQFWWNFPCLMSEGYIFIKVMIKDFNSQCHQHQGTGMGWCAWLNANPIPSYLIKSSGIVEILKSWKLLSLLNSKRDLKFYFLHMKSDEVGTTLKHPEAINGNVKNLSKRIENESKGECHFYFKNLILAFITFRI